MPPALPWHYVDAKNEKAFEQLLKSRPIVTPAQREFVRRVCICEAPNGKPMAHIQYSADSTDPSDLSLVVYLVFACNGKDVAMDDDNNAHHWINLKSAKAVPNEDEDDSSPDF
jgi:hypothetical protein